MQPVSIALNAIEISGASFVDSCRANNVQRILRKSEMCTNRCNRTVICKGIFLWRWISRHFDSQGCCNVCAADKRSLESTTNNRLIKSFAPSVIPSHSTVRKVYLLAKVASTDVKGMHPLSITNNRAQETTCRFCE